MSLGRGSLPQGQAYCQPCRREQPRPTKGRTELSPSYVANYRTWPKLGRDPRPCLWCGKTFQPRAQQQAHCSRSCGQLHLQQRRRQDPNYQPPKKIRTPYTESSTARGYDSKHSRVRDTWLPTIAAGHGHCHATTCLEPTRWIQPGTAWDMGHTPDRTTWTGPEHRRCNRSAGGKSRGKKRRLALTAARW
jgi:hypothetical protein